LKWVAIVNKILLLLQK